MDNFLSNALKYTQEGTVEITPSIENDMGCVAVKDSGIGISKEDLQHLGKKFFRAKQYIKESTNPTQKVVRPGGTGLGLYVVFELIKLMRGTKKIESEVGKGSTFTFCIPIYDGQPDKHFDQTFLASESQDTTETETVKATPEASTTSESTTTPST